VRSHSIRQLVQTQVENDQLGDYVQRGKGGKSVGAQVEVSQPRQASDARVVRPVNLLSAKDYCQWSSSAVSAKTVQCSRHHAFVGEPRVKIVQACWRTVSQSAADQQIARASDGMPALNEAANAFFISSCSPYPPRSAHFVCSTTLTLQPSSLTPSLSNTIPI